MIFIFVTALATIVAGVSASAKSAVVMAHYGSSNDDTRVKTIGRITADVRSAFPDMEVREAFISPVVRRNLSKRGIDAPSTEEALLRLRVEGYDTVYVQPSSLLDGAETAEVRRSVEAVAPFFSHVATGLPLLYSPSDCEEVVKVLLQEPCGPDEAVVFVGHGNMLPSTASYSQLDVMLGARSAGGVYHTGTIEGYPTLEATLRQLQASGSVKRVRLVPLLLVCGNHTLNDIAGEYAGGIRKAGYEATTELRGLAENPAIRRLYVERVRRLTGK